MPQLLNGVFYPGFRTPLEFLAYSLLAFGNAALDRSKTYQTLIDQAETKGFFDVRQRFLGCKGHQDTDDAADHRLILLCHGPKQVLP